MANTVKLKRSAVASKVPLTTDLQLGELAINTYDGVLYTLKNNGTASVVQLSGGGTVSSVATGTGLTGGPITSSGTISLASGVATAGTYKSVTVDTYGRVTAGTNPTTLAGYGITDAPTTTGTGASGSWGISVTGSSASCTGNAATATSATSATTATTATNQSGGTVSATTGSFSGNVTLSGTGTIQVPVGTTAQRPTAAQGMIRYNTTRGCFEGYTGSVWVNMSPLNIDDVGATA
jgi:phage-related tail fiber protein